MRQWAHRERHGWLLFGVERDNQEAACREHLLALQNG